MISVIFVISILLTSGLAFYLGFRAGSDQLSIMSSLIILRLRKNLNLSITDSEFSDILKQSSIEAKEMYTNSELS